MSENNRFLTLESPLGPDALFLRGFTGREALSQLFRFRLDVLSDNPRLNVSDLLGQHMTVRMRHVVDEDNTLERFFNGVVSRISQLPSEGRRAHYRIELVPWLWLLSRTTDCRIFQNKTVSEIVQQVFQHAGFQHVAYKLHKTYVRREYCVQYQETSLSFVMRLLEDEGICFFFRHERGKHTLVLADTPMAHPPCSGRSRVRYATEDDQRGDRAAEAVSKWEVRHELRPSHFASADFSFRTPTQNMLVTTKNPISQGQPNTFERFTYPGGYQTRDHGESVVRKRMEEDDSSCIVIRGASNVPTFGAGYRFTLAEHERPDQPGEYVLTAVRHMAQEGALYSGGGSQASGYQNSFRCLPAGVPFLPPRVTPKPRVQGSQTAIVVGPAGEQVYADRYGRVKVQFHWDRYGKCDPNSSCWIRVSQPWAGKGWGALFLPRIGQEVIVDFLEGDPDRPVITGRLYNAEQTPCYEVSGGRMLSGFKSRTRKGGSNEILLDDDEEIIQIKNSGGTITLGPEGIKIEGPGGTIIIGTNGISIEGLGNTIQLGPSGLKIQGTTVHIN